MPQYIFTFDERDKGFPKRYRVVSRDDDAEFLRYTEDLTGTVPDAEAIEFLDGLLARYRSDESLRAKFVDAPYWKFIEFRSNPAEAGLSASEPKNPRGGGFVT